MSEWVKKGEREGEKVWWLFDEDVRGEHIFSFDKEKRFNLFQDYPDALTAEEKKIFDEENPFWAGYFKEG